MLDRHDSHPTSAAQKRLTVTPDTLIADFSPRLQSDQKKALKALNLVTVKDLLYHFPSRYGDVAEIKNVSSFSKGDNVTIFGKVLSIKTSKGFVKKMAMAQATIDDGSATIKAIWFHQPYIAKMMPEGSLVKLTGKVAERRGKVKADGTVTRGELYLTNPEHEVIPELPTGVGSSLFGETKEQFESYAYPVYPETKGITSKWIYHETQKLFSLGVHEKITDPIPADVLARYNLPSLSTALVWIHSPRREADAQAARKRFAFEEIFFIQLQKQQQRKLYEREKAFDISKSPRDLDEFIARFPFKATEAQLRTINDIMEDFKRGYPMARLLEGDVGSGKTAVAAVTTYAVATTRPAGQNFGTLQIAYMAPTEILASQHFESFITYFKHLPIQIALMTGSGCRKFPSKVNPEGWTNISRAQLLKWVASGEISVVIGTQALIQKSVAFKHLAYAIVDEQHRFGVNQRQKLTTKESSVKAKTPMPHLLSMTATPIPRTLALTIYGDLDLSLLDAMPAGRKPVITEIVLPGNVAREKVYEKMRAQLAEGRQAYVICPRINEPDPEKEKAINAKSVTEEANRLKRDVFHDYAIDILHSKMTPEKKDAAMMRFSKGETDILVSTSVVEVGVNVPNATVMIIEGAERFGLAQLHQLRGRVIRGTHQPYCYVFADSKTQTTIARLKAFITAKNGFELAEYDLTQRGSGALSGGKQWGISDIAMEAIRNIKLVEAARKEALALVEKDPDLTSHPLMRAHIERAGNIHFE